MYDNYMKIEFKGISQNESFARVAVASFISLLDPTIEEITDVKTAVSEAVTNSIIHGYENKGGLVKVEGYLKDSEFTVIVSDEGIGIEDIEKAREPLFTSRPDLERSGMGFTVMETFMDQVFVESKPGAGTKVTMKKIIKH